jgi:tetratricopeptide (TPR) repeat protein
VEISLRKLDFARQHASQSERINASDVRLALLKVQIEGLTGDPERIRETLRVTAKRFPQNAKLHGEIGHWLFTQRRAEIDPLALSALLRAQQAGARDPQTALALASLQSMAGATDDALRNALRVIEQTTLPEERRAAAAAIAGECYAQSGRLEEAVRHLKMAVEWMPGIEHHALALARLHRANKDYTAAKAVLEQARRRGADSPDLLIALGSNLLSNANAAEAVTVLRELIARFPDREEAYGLLAQAYRSSGDLALASGTLLNLSERKPRYPMIHVSLARALLEEGPNRQEAALAALAKAEQVTPADPDIYLLRAKVLMSQGRYDDAVVALTRAIRLQPDSPGYHYQLGLAYQRQGKQAEARKQFERMQHLRDP